jgi:hypothetical protein
MVTSSVRANARLCGFRTDHIKGPTDVASHAAIGEKERMKNIATILLLVVGLSGCGGAAPEAEEPSGGDDEGGGAQIAGATGSGQHQIAGGSTTLDQPERQLARHAADLVLIMRDHAGDCERAARMCDDYVAGNRASIEDAKAELKQAIEQAPPDVDLEDEIGEDLERLMLQMVPDSKRIMESFEDRCPGIADDVGRALNL